ncbi:uncharacterized protein HD556DRAFT_1192960, partial [Suillus plorans]
KKSRELDPAMDCLINAHLRDTIQCRCRVFCVHFDEISAMYGDSNLCDYGLSLVMLDSVLDCIVDCAQHKKFVTIQDLHKETWWSGSDEFGGDIIAIVHCLFPVPTSTPVTHFGSSP